MSSPSPEWIEASDLMKWERIGGGGFGQIFKARHGVWCCDVAIKRLLHDDRDGSSLLREVRMMHQGSSPYVIRVLGVMRFPSSPSLGLVMEFMEKGSLEFLQRTLQKPPPWPLLFRLAHQVALGMNFLHSRNPAVLHLDLKPNNVLLDSYLNAKLTDFGLAKTDSSPLRRDSEQEVGTTSFMPPEAFDKKYTPSRATDIYSYGILLWCISTGKLPYGCKMSSMVRFRIPKGDRPSLDEIDSHDILAELKELMTRCWLPSPDQRPSFRECTTQTEKLYEKLKCDIDEAVHEVLIKLKEKQAELRESFQVSHSSGSTRNGFVDSYRNVPTGPSPVQEIAGALGGIQIRDRGEEEVGGEAATARCSPPGQHQESCKSSPVKPSSVRPIDSPASSSKESPPPSEEKHTHRVPGEHQHQFSRANPSTSPVQININFSNVTGVQQGYYNNMHIVTVDPVERRRHLTAQCGVSCQNQADVSNNRCVCQ